MMAASNGVPKKKRTTRIRPAPDPDPPPANSRRSLRPRRRRPLDGDYFDDDYDVDEEDDQEEDEGRRKLKSVLRIPPGNSRPPPSFSSSEEEVMPTKKRRVEESGDESDGSSYREVSSPELDLTPPKLTLKKRRNVVRKTASGTLLQDKAVLLEILDKLQKKDTYSVFAQPVDPVELPDYYDVIEHPMDFGTVRRKLTGGVYRSFNQLEDDVFLICNNAMQYNAPDTIYFRQANSIQDMARKKFQELRAGTISSTARSTEENASFHTVEKTLKKPQYRNMSEPVQSSMSPAEKIIKKPHCRTAPDRHGSDFLSRQKKKIIKKTQYRASPNPVGSHFSSRDKKKLKYLNVKSELEPLDPDICSFDNNSLTDPFRKTVREAHVPDILSLGKKIIKKPRSRIASQAHHYDMQTPNRQNHRKTLGRLDSVISSGNKKSKSAQCRNLSKPADSERKTSNTVLCRPSAEPLDSDSSGATFASAADTCSDKSRLQAQDLSSSVEACAGLSTAQGDDLPSAAEAHARLSPVEVNAVERVAINGAADESSSLGEIKSEKADEVPGKSLPSKLGMKPFAVDLNRRTTYTRPEQEEVVEPEFVFDVFGGELKNLVTVEAPLEYSYATSLARFAASLGPIGWDIASKRIEQVLPPDVKFGPGWVGEYEPFPSPVIYCENEIRMQQRQNELRMQQRQQQLHGHQKLPCQLQKLQQQRPIQQQQNQQVMQQQPHQLDMQQPSQQQMQWQMQQHPIMQQQQQQRFQQQNQLLSMQQQQQLQAMQQQQQKHLIQQQHPIQQKHPMQQQLPIQKQQQQHKMQQQQQQQRPKQQQQQLKPVQQQQQWHTMQQQQQQRAMQQQQLAMQQQRSMQQHQQQQLVQQQQRQQLSQHRHIKQEEHQQQQQQIQQPQKVTKKDKGNERKSKTTQNGYQKNMPFHLESGVTSVKSLISSSGVEEINQKRTQDQKQGLFGIDLARPPATSSSMPRQHKQEAADFPNVYTNEVTAYRPQSSSEVAKSTFPPIVPKERDQVKAEPIQQVQGATPQRRKNAVGMSVPGSGMWRSSDNIRSNGAPGILPNQQAGVHYWFSQGSQEQATSDPLRWTNSSGKCSNQSKIAEVHNTSLESSTHTVHAKRQTDPSSASSQSWMSLGAPAERKSVDAGSVNSNQVGSASFNSPRQNLAQAPEVHEVSKVKLETAQIASEPSQVQNKGLVIFPQLMATELSRSRSPWPGMVQHTNQKDQLPLDLNISFQPPGSPVPPSSGIQIDSQQTDLALQL